MKKTLLTLLLFTAFISNAQRVKPGIRAGMNISDITGTDNTEAKQDFYVGAHIAIRVSNFYTLQPELTYSRQGFTAQITESKNQNVDLHYISIGLTNKFFFAKNLGLYALVGPSLNIKENDVPHYFNNFDAESNDSYSPIDFSLYGGIGYEFPFGLAIEARYKHGAIDIDGDNFILGTTNDDFNINKTFQIGLSYNLSFKKK